MLYGLAGLKTAGKMDDVSVDVASKGEDGFAVCKFEFFVIREVEFEFEQGGEMEQLVAELGEVCAEVAAEL